MRTFPLAHGGLPASSMRWEDGNEVQRMAAGRCRPRRLDDMAAAETDTVPPCCGSTRRDRCRSRGSTCRRDDLGFAGGCSGRRTTPPPARFMKQTFATETVVATPETVEAEMQALLDAGVWWIVTLADEDTTVRLADIAGDKGAGAERRARPDDRLRGEDCRANLLHVAPSDAMLTDALAQYLVWKRWTDWFLIEGSHPGGPGAGRGLPARGDEVRREDRRGAGLRGHRRRAAHRLAATCRCRRRCRPSPSARRSTTW